MIQLLLVLLLTTNCFAGSAQYLPILKDVIDKNWSEMPLREIPAAQIEQESSWKENAKLSTSRELGRGLTQITIAYDKNGKERFNNFREAVKLKELKSWNWEQDPYNVRFQMTYLVLTDRSNYKTICPYMFNQEESFKASLVAYNAGLGRWQKRRAVAKLKGLRSDLWTNGLDSSYSDNEKVLLYGRPLYSAVNEYPTKIFNYSKKYKGKLK